MNQSKNHGRVASRHAPSAVAAVGAVDATSATIVDGGGQVLTSASVQLIFWGSDWVTATSPSSGDVTTAVTKILSSTYMSSLSQYRGVGSGVLLGGFTSATPVGGSPADPPNPFSNVDVSGLISDLIDAGLVAGPDTSQILYMVIMPPGVGFINSNDIGEHSVAQLSGVNMHFGWVTNDGTLEHVTTVFSHELVEACTDPEGDAIQLNAPGFCSPNPTSWCEIADVCTSNGVLNGAPDVRVQSYWSANDGKCIAPDSNP